MELWLAATIGAVIFQTLRFSLQKVITLSDVGALGSTFARFICAIPFLWLGLAAYSFEHALPPLHQAFWLYSLTGGLGQIAGTVCLMAVFARRNFAVGITFKKTEVIQTVFVALILIQETIPWLSFLAIIGGLIGVFLLSWQDMGKNVWQNPKAWMGTSAFLGLLSGAFFAFAAVGVRAATLEVASDNAFERAFIALFFTVHLQVILMASWMFFKSRSELWAVWKARKIAIWIGLSSLVGSLFWFLAYTLQKAALVTAVAQIEIIFSLLISYFYFKEKIALREIIGMAVLSASLILLLFSL